MYNGIIIMKEYSFQQYLFIHLNYKAWVSFYLLMNEGETMSIKFRLLLSYIALLLVPVILTLAFGVFAGYYYIGDFHKKYPVIDRLHTIKEILLERDTLFSDMKKAALASPNKLEEEDFLRNFEERLQTFNSGIIVRKNNQIIYNSSLIHHLVSTEDLPAFGEYRYEYPISPKDMGRQLSLSQHDFYFEDGSEGSVFLITNNEPVGRNLKTLMHTLTIIMTIILIITNGILTYLVAGSIVKPLEKLKDSANRIKEGDLDFEINMDTKDEIGELSHAFEEMRKRLKKSIDLQHQYEENRKELFANISHDLKTPITTIKGYIEGIKDGVADTPDKMNKYINTIYAKTVDVDRLIDDLFLFSKLDLSKQPLHLSTLDLVQYLTDLLEEMKFDLEEKNISINFHNKIGRPALTKVDVMQLKRVIVNVIENAIKYMNKPQGRIDIYLDKIGNQVLVEIKDNGQGIPEDILPYIFERFYRGDPSRNTSTGGSGLGLAIAKKIIEEHDGTMWAESVEGMGTSIFFTFHLL